MIRHTAGIIVAACVAYVIATARADGVIALGILALAVWLWTYGVFTAAFWMIPARVEDEPSRLDQLQMHGHPEGRR